MKRLKEIKKKNLGFTLVEILVVLAIIAVIVGVVYIAVDTARKKTRDAIIISSLEQIQALAETIYNPVDGYKKLSNHPNIEDIRNKIKEMGKDFNLNFTDNDPNYRGNYREYCSYVPLHKKNEHFCVDYRGVRIKIDVANNEHNCELLRVPFNCDLR